MASIVKNTTTTTTTSSSSNDNGDDTDDKPIIEVISDDNNVESVKERYDYYNKWEKKANILVEETELTEEKEKVNIMMQHQFFIF